MRAFGIVYWRIEWGLPLSPWVHWVEVLYFPRMHSLEFEVDLVVGTTWTDCESQKNRARNCFRFLEALPDDRKSRPNSSLKMMNRLSTYRIAKKLHWLQKNCTDGWAMLGPELSKSLSPRTFYYGDCKVGQWRRHLAADTCAPNLTTSLIDSWEDMWIKTSLNDGRDVLDVEPFDCQGSTFNGRRWVKNGSNESNVTESMMTEVKDCNGLKTKT